ncbi:MAG: HAMP domain-containing histidine kinase [Lentisphaerae bacterium]|nr:HAMP domain-containing histidine kinase [Lentisphaerota bacterium]
MRGTLRVQFFKWLTLQTGVVFIAQVIGLKVFNLHEISEHPAMAGDERTEFRVLLTGMLILWPLAVGVAWILSRRLVEPIRSMLSTAETIREGDLTQRVTTERSDDELGRLGSTINAAFDRYQETLERLERFSYDASHQLRTPLAAMRASAEVCLSRPRRPAEYQETLGRVLEEVGRLSRTVDQLLTLAKLSPAQIEVAFVAVDMLALAREVVAEFGPVCEMQGIALTIVETPGRLTVRGVRELLREALHNIVDNAMRFTPGRGQVRIEVMPDATSVRVRVGDSGPGLPDEGRGLAFRPFRRGAGSSRRDGHGLGLAIVSDIVAAHHGSLDASRSDLGGAAFTISLPVAS